jgi:hypothetical protein
MDHSQKCTFPTILHHAATHQPEQPRLRLSKAIWDSLTPEGQRAWDTLSGEEKASILNMHQHNAQGSVLHSLVEEVHDIPANDENTDDTTEALDVNSGNVESSANRASSTRPTGVLRSILNPSEAPRYAATSSNMHLISEYTVSNIQGQIREAALMDRGANGGIAGLDVRVLGIDDSYKINITGTDNHQMTNLNVVTVGAYSESQKGPVILIFNQYTHTKEGRTIHSSPQLEHYKVNV